MPSAADEVRPASDDRSDTDTVNEAAVADGGSSADPRSEDAIDSGDSVVVDDEIESHDADADLHEQVAGGVPMVVPETVTTPGSGSASASNPPKTLVERASDVAEVRSATAGAFDAVVAGDDSRGGGIVDAVVDPASSSVETEPTSTPAPTPGVASTVQPSIPAIDPDATATPVPAEGVGATVGSAQNATDSPAPGSARSEAATTRPGATTLPQGMQPVAPPPAEPTSATLASGAASTSSRPRPAGGARPDRTSSEAPAAVARANRVNQAIEAARAGDANVVTEAATRTGVGPVMAGDAAASTNRLSAQSMPNAGANAALPTPDDAAPPTMPGVARGLDALARQKGGSLVMRLDPPSLGQLRLEMRMEGGRVSVLMTAASESARSLLRDNLGSLRTALEDRGLAVDRLAVETAGRTSESSNSRSENRGDGQDARGGQDASGRQDAGDGRSRGRRDDAAGRQKGRGDGPGRQEAVEFREALAGAGASDQ